MNRSHSSKNSDDAFTSDDTKESMINSWQSKTAQQAPNPVQQQQYNPAPQINVNTYNLDQMMNDQNQLEDYDYGSAYAMIETFDDGADATALYDYLDSAHDIDDENIDLYNQFISDANTIKTAPVHPVMKQYRVKGAIPISFTPQAITQYSLPQSAVTSTAASAYTSRRSSLSQSSTLNYGVSQLNMQSASASQLSHGDQMYVDALNRMRAISDPVTPVDPQSSSLQVQQQRFPPISPKIALPTSHNQQNPFRNEQYGGMKLIGSREERKQRRLEKNREAAKESRRKKKEHVRTLELKLESVLEELELQKQELSWYRSKFGQSDQDAWRDNHAARQSCLLQLRALDPANNQISSGKENALDDPRQ
ncbi:hypothetical protein MIR68_007126 [Amoeboaphelidium protococcarum]|nr:hypothetical protein MIR68_007126 [Amoeboaphelidium protococcarum]